ncbi:hypothetical protein [Burkholderia orbicola]|uniref:hypothetical protein n=1 Tax=Burkholderia orbicola TaxID=2978683 RepID=UPI00264E21E5|nr:hypothetical protein [Burkholderia orbicola]MDN7535604.1 hypothetical protein [Burkholderia orbicola]
MIASDFPLKNLGTLSEQAAPPLTPRDDIFLVGPELWWHLDLFEGRALRYSAIDGQLMPIY